MKAATKAVGLRTPAQNRMIWTLRSELCRLSGLSEEDVDISVLRPAVREISGQEHTSRLNEVQAERVIRHLDTHVAQYRKQPTGRPAPAEHKPWGSRGPGPRADAKITPFQQGVISGLYRLMGWDQQRQIGFCQRQNKIPWPQTQAHADALIEPLSAMVMRGLDAESIRARANTANGHRLLNDWQKGFVADLCRQFDEASEAGVPIKKVITAHKLLKLLEAEARCGLEYEASEKA